MKNEYLFYIFYTLIVMTSFLLIFSEDKYTTVSKKKIIIILMVLLAILSAFRPLTIPDTTTYISSFYSYIDMESVLKSGFSLGTRYTGYGVLSMEPGFVILIYLFRTIINSHMIFFGVISFIVSYTVTFGLCNIYGHLKNGMKRIPVFTIWACYLMSFGLHYTSVAIRAGITFAIGISVISLFVRSNKKIVKYVLCPILIIISSTIQTFGILFLFILICFSLKLGISKKKYLIAALAGMVLFWVILNGKALVDGLISLINSVRDTFSITAFSSYIYGYEIILSKQEMYRVLVTFILVLLGMDKTEETKIPAFISFVGMMIIIVAYPFPAIGRMADYFLLFSILVSANYISTKRHMTLKKFAYIILLVTLYPSQMALIIIQ